MRILRTLILITSAALLLTSCAPGSSNDNADSKETAEDKNDSKFDASIKDDTEFAVAVADGGMLEVQLGQLAQERAASPTVKRFGQMMVDDHSKANDELKALASTKNISIPTSLSDKNQKRYDEIAEKSGTEFDKAYAEFMVKDHKEDIDKFKKQADDGKDPDLKSWAAGKLATLEHHLEMAEQAEESLKGTK
jgi:putative membrane protein